jgi:hypothetical protein
MELRSQLLFDMQAEVRERYSIENTPRGTRVNVSVAGGTFTGPKLKGTILPGGGDFALVRPDGVVEIDVRITLWTDDGQHIYMTYRGLNAQGAEYAQRIQRGEAVSATELYFRTTPYFETSAPNTRGSTKSWRWGCGRTATQAEPSPTGSTKSCEGCAISREAMP